MGCPRRISFGATTRDIDESEVAHKVLVVSGPELVGQDMGKPSPPPVPFPCRSRPGQEDQFGQGPVCASCHVMIPKEFTDKIEPPLPHEISLLEVRRPCALLCDSRLKLRVCVSKRELGVNKLGEGLTFARAAPSFLGIRR